MDSLRPMRITYMVLNAIFWVVGLCLLGYICWTAATHAEPSSFLSGVQIFNYVLLGTSCLIVIIGFLGCVTGCIERKWLLVVYLTSMMVLLLAELGAVIYLLAQKQQLHTFKKSVWSGLTTAFKDNIQIQLQCCGYEGRSEYVYLPKSCYAVGTDGQPAASHYNATCSGQIEIWLDSNVPVWVSILACLALVEILAMLASCHILGKMQSLSRVYPLQEVENRTRVESLKADIQCASDE